MRAHGFAGRASPPTLEKNRAVDDVAGVEGTGECEERGAGVGGADNWLGLNREPCSLERY